MNLFFAGLFAGFGAGVHLACNHPWQALMYAAGATIIVGLAWYWRKRHPPKIHFQVDYDLPPREIVVLRNRSMRKYAGSSDVEGGNVPAGITSALQSKESL